MAERAKAVLWRIARAEARVHGATPEEIHFHEVGAVDTLIDVCGAVLALERLAVERIVSAPPLVGEGTVDCAHGRMPVPAPAVAELMKGLPTVLGGGDGEDVITAGLGFEYRAPWMTKLRIAHETPLTDNDDLFGHRWTVSAIFSF